MHPVLFRIGPITIYSYGVCVAAAFLVGIVTTAVRARRYGWKSETIYDLSFYILIAAIAGSRLLYVIENPAEFAAHPWEIFTIWRGGLVYYGGVIAAVAAAGFYLRRHRLSIGKGFDLFAPSLALGHAVGRVGCFLNGCCFGIPCSLPWAVVFPKGSPAYTHQLYVAGYLPPGRPWTLPVHPVQLYAAGIELAIFVVLSLAMPRKKFDGQIFWLYLLLYGAARFAMEFLRADNSTVLHLGAVGLTLPQVMSAVAMGVASAVLLVRRGR